MYINEKGDDTMKNLGFGLMRLPITKKTVRNEKIDKEKSAEMIKAYLDKGFNYLILHTCITAVKAKVPQVSLSAQSMKEALSFSQVKCL